MEICPLGAALVHADRWTERRTVGHDEGNRSFSRLCERALKNVLTRTNEELPSENVWQASVYVLHRTPFIHSVFCLTTGPKPPPK